MNPSGSPTADLIGRRLSHYRVDAPLGSGGMGVVFRAHDEHLDRDVALKVLPQGALADDASRTRFRSEAMALSRLNHPAIGTVFDFDSQDGLDFIVMEFVPGATLAARLSLGPLAEDEAVPIALQIAEALEAAHEQGIVHRDLKPANVMVTDRGRVKVLDFGIALRVDLDAGRGATLTGKGPVGTVAYMAPEQLLGNKPDARADVFAFGVVLYEMVTGANPFHAPTMPAIMNAILNQPAAAPRRLRPELSSAAEAVILRCLEKEPRRRYPTTKDLSAELRGLTSDRRSRGPKRIESIAVLPLANLSGDPEQEYFADGMTEALISDLARIGALRVVSRRSAMRYKGAQQSLPEIARELGVDAVVEGSVHRVGDRVRITAELIEAVSDRHLWAERYERDMRDVLGIQSEVAQAIAREVQVKLTSQEQAQLSVKRSVDPDAHEAYLKGRHLWNLRTPEALQRAIEYFQRAIERDPSYAPAHSGLADCYNILADNNLMAPAQVFLLAETAARKALQLDDQLAEAHTSLAYVYHDFYWNWDEAERLFQRAIELDRGYATAHQWYGILLACLKRFDEAIAHGNEAVKLDPLSRILYTTVGDANYYARRYEEAIGWYRQAIEFSPDFVQARFDLGRSLEQAGRYEDALTEFEIALGMTNGDRTISAALACTYGFMGQPDRARPILQKLKERARERYVAPYSLASIHAALGEADQAVEWLERAHVAHDRAMIYLSVNPRFDRLRTEPRFQALVTKMNLPA
jgi:eukaryotic-like serine/threonine-protein kinase